MQDETFIVVYRVPICARGIAACGLEFAYRRRGLHGYSGVPSAVRLVVRNPSAQPQLIHLQLAASEESDVTDTVTTNVSLKGTEQRELELPVALPPGNVSIVVEASEAGAVFGHDTYKESLRQSNLIVLMCASENICKTAQSEIQFSGSVENRADKNRQVAFEMVQDSRDHWWAYSAARAVVLAMPMSEFTSAQRDALEGFLRRGGRLILVEQEIADRRVCLFPGATRWTALRLGLGMSDST